MVCVTVAIASLLLTMNGGSHHLRGGLSSGGSSGSSNSSADVEVVDSSDNVELNDGNSSIEADGKGLSSEKSSTENEHLSTEEDAEETPMESSNGEGAEPGQKQKQDSIEEDLSTEEDLPTEEPILNSNGPWPECLGIHSDNCVNIITHHTSASGDVQIQLVEPDLFVTTDWVLNRVRIYVDEDYFVSDVPKRG